MQARVGVVVLAATNRLDCVDPALLRPGRFDRLVRVVEPDAAGRLAILQVQTRRTPLAADVNLQVGNHHASMYHCLRMDWINRDAVNIIDGFGARQAKCMWVQSRCPSCYVVGQMCAWLRFLFLTLTCSMLCKC